MLERCMPTCTGDYGNTHSTRSNFTMSGPLTEGTAVLRRMEPATSPCYIPDTATVCNLSESTLPPPLQAHHAGEGESAGCAVVRTVCEVDARSQFAESHAARPPRSLCSQSCVFPVPLTQRTS